MATLNLGKWRTLSGEFSGRALRLPANHLVTHGVVVGMTGSGKTGLLTVLAEEALRAAIPTLIIDVKGDLPNVLYTFPNFGAEHYAPWLESNAQDAGASVDVMAQALAVERTAQFQKWDLSEADLGRFHTGTHVRVLTPGATSGEPLHVLSPLEPRSTRWDSDPESARAALSATVSLVLRLLGRDPDPAKSKDHVLLSVLAERRLLTGGNAELPALMNDITQPPIETVGHARGLVHEGGRAQPVGSGAQHAARLAHVRQLAAGRTPRRPRLAHTQIGADPRHHPQRGPPGRRGTGAGARRGAGGGAVLGARAARFTAASRLGVVR